MKSLNDSLREEFDEILNKIEYKTIIDNEGLDKAVLKKVRFRSD